jgi:hypothetical protein
MVVSGGEHTFQKTSVNLNMEPKLLEGMEKQISGSTQKFLVWWLKVEPQKRAFLASSQRRLVLPLVEEDYVCVSGVFGAVIVEKPRGPS